MFHENGPHDVPGTFDVRYTYAGGVELHCHALGENGVKFTGSEGSVFVKLIVTPLVNLIWLARLLFVAGALLTLWPDAREQRRLARRFAEEGALARA